VVCKVATSNEDATRSQEEKRRGANCQKEQTIWTTTQSAQASSNRDPSVRAMGLLLSVCCTGLDGWIGTVVVDARTDELQIGDKRSTQATSTTDSQSSVASTIVESLIVIPVLEESADDGKQSTTQAVPRGQSRLGQGPPAAPYD
jgi:hypothetical protein